MTKQKRARESTETTITEAVNGAHGLERPPIRPLDLAWVKSVVVNSAGAARRAGEIGTRRTVKKGEPTHWPDPHFEPAIACR